MDLGGDLLGVFLVACRVGGCLMLMPGFSSARVPVRVRLFIAIAIALVVAPIAIERDALKGMSGDGLARVIFAEIVSGAIMGFVARIYLSGLGFMTTAMAHYIGLNALGGSIDGDEAMPSLASLVTVLATLVLFAWDLHRLVVVMVIESYARLPLSVMPEFGAILRLTASSLQAAFFLGLQVIGPFVIYGILVNMIFGILGKLIPQVPSYFISVPFLLAGGFVLLYFSLPMMMKVFSQGFQSAFLAL